MTPLLKQEIDKIKAQATAGTITPAEIAALLQLLQTILPIIISLLGGGAVPVPTPTPAPATAKP
jgi:hypothetical protein